MSRRPGIHSEHEQRVEAQIQDERRARDGRAHDGKARDGRARDERLSSEPAGDEAAGDSAASPKPTILSASRGPVEGGVTDDVAQWIDAEATEQQTHYRRIYRQIEALAPSRDRWVEEFQARITGPRGFSVHAGTRCTIPEDQIPERPERPWRLVW